MTLIALEPTPAEVARHAAALAIAYNDPHNAPLLGHTERLDEADVIAHYARLAAGGDHGFLVLRAGPDGAGEQVGERVGEGAGELLADGDLRGVRDGVAELAFLVARVDHQGRGLGTRVALLLHAFAFLRLGLERVYASVRPDNPASRRVFDKLGHAEDTSPDGRAYAEEPDDLVLVAERAAFLESHAAALAEIRITVRPSPA